jgi:CheY-like chemotaxis protein
MKTVLVVDDEPSVRLALAAGLTDRRRGVKVATAANGLEAVAVLESERVDLVLTDLRMPEMDGFELLAHLRRHFASLPVVVMTAFGGNETAARLDGAVECFTKPFNVLALKAKIVDLLAQRVKGRVENITLPSFLQLLELERKTCTLAITSLGRAGGALFPWRPAGGCGEGRALRPGRSPGDRHLGRHRHRDFGRLPAGGARDRSWPELFAHGRHAASGRTGERRSASSRVSSTGGGREQTGAAPAA